MNRSSIDWAGAFPALTTPFTKDDRIDEKAFAANVDRLIAAGEPLQNFNFEARRIG